jgi:hypothetical protein
MEERDEKTFRSLMIVVAIALSFFVWGLFIFFSVGDKGSPSWDFGIVPDVPGESAYSTHPLRSPEPEPQHVSQKPLRTETGGKEGK